MARGIWQSRPSLEASKHIGARWWWHMPLAPALVWQRQVDLCEFRISLVYKLSSRTHRTVTQRKPYGGCVCVPMSLLWIDHRSMGEGFLAVLPGLFCVCMFLAEIESHCVDKAVRELPASDTSTYWD